MLYSILRVASLVVLLSSSCGVFWSKKKKTQGCQDGQCNQNVVLQVFNNGDWIDGKSVSLTPSECTTNKDLGEMVCPKIGMPSTCALFSAWGTRVTSCVDAKADNNVFVVPSNRLFMLPTHGVGHRTEIAHIGMPTGKPIVLETLSEYPRIFRVKNFFTEEEADQLIESALALEGDAFRLKRSSTGTNGYSIDERRTSDNAFDTNSPLAATLKRRTFDLLGIFPYDESYADGIQILRYNESAGYATDMDWIPPPKDASGLDHNYHSEADGTNRYATLLLYLSDTEVGGETVFPFLDPLPPYLDTCSAEYDPHYYSTSGESIEHSKNVLSSVEDLTVEYERKVTEAAMEESLSFLQEVDPSRDWSQTYPPQSWQRDTIAMAKLRLALKPKKAEAILFYSQTPDGKPDFRTTHGASPVIQGSKWAANLWVWNGPRNGYWKKDPETGKLEMPKLQSVSVSFESKDVIGSRLFWEDQLWEELQPGRPIKVNTYAGHRWKVKLDNELLKTWTVEANKPSQRFILSSEDLPTFQMKDKGCGRW